MEFLPVQTATCRTGLAVSDKNSVGDKFSSQDESKVHCGAILADNGDWCISGSNSWSVAGGVSCDGDCDCDWKAGNELDASPVACATTASRASSRRF